MTRISFFELNSLGKQKMEKIFDVPYPGPKSVVAPGLGNTFPNISCVGFWFG
jgi:hypothetical protein